MYVQTPSQGWNEQIDDLHRQLPSILALEPRRSTVELPCRNALTACMMVRSMLSYLLNSPMYQTTQVYAWVENNAFVSCAFAPEGVVPRKVM